VGNVTKWQTAGNDEEKERKEQKQRMEGNKE
jgi:hypothetical protein